MQRGAESTHPGLHKQRDGNDSDYMVSGNTPRKVEVLPEQCVGCPLTQAPHLPHGDQCKDTTAIARCQSPRRTCTQRTSNTSCDMEDGAGGAAKVVLCVHNRPTCGATNLCPPLQGWTRHCPQPPRYPRFRGQESGKKSKGEQQKRKLYPVLFPTRQAAWAGYRVTADSAESVPSLCRLVPSQAQSTHRGTLDEWEGPRAVQAVPVAHATRAHPNLHLSEGCRRRWVHSALG